MANPNIVGVTTILGNTSSISANTGNGVQSTVLVNNPASSGEIYKVNTILATSVNTASAVEATVVLYHQDDLQGAPRHIAHKISVPAQSTLIVLDKTTSIYLTEDMSIGANASSNDSITFHASWEEISSS